MKSQNFNFDKKQFLNILEMFQKGWTLYEVFNIRPWTCSNQRWIQTFRHSQKNQSSQNKRLFSSNNSQIRHFVEHSVYKVQLVVKVTPKNLRANVLQNFANYESIIEFWSIFTLNMYFSYIYWEYLSLRNIQIVKLAKIKGFIWNSKFSLFLKRHLYTSIVLTK